MRGERLYRRSVLTRLLRVGYAVYALVLAALAAVAIVVGGTIMLLETRWGAELAKRIALGQVNTRIAGRLALARLTFTPERLTLDGLELDDPDGHAVVTIERLEIAFSPRALLRRRLEVGAIVIRQPRVVLIESARGLTLGRSLASATRSPTESPPGGSGRSFTIRVRGWELTGGELDWRRADGGRLLRLAELATFGELQLSEAELRTSLTIEAPDARLDLRGRIGFTAGRLSSFQATASSLFPGTSMTARGTGSDATLKVGAELTADDLGALGRWAGAIVATPLPAVTGRGRVAVALSGPIAGPRLRLEARAPTVRVGRDGGRDLKAVAVVPDLRIPEALDFDVSAAAGSLGGHRFRALAAGARASGRRVTARVRVTGPEPLSLDLDGRREASGRALRIDALRLGYPEAAWSLARPARLVLGPERFAVAGLALRAGRQHLEVDIVRGPREGRPSGPVETKGHVAVTGLDLALLPRALLPPGTKPGGRLDAEVRFAAAAGPPRFEVSAGLSGGRLGALRDVALRLEARAAAGRADGHLEARGAGASLTARFDGPMRWPPARGRGAVAAELSLVIPDLAATRAAVVSATDARPPKLAGQARLHVRFDGAADRPALAIDVKGTKLALAGRPIGDLAAWLHAEGDRPSEAGLEATETLARTPIELGGQVERVPVALLAPLVPALSGLPRLGGTLSSQFTLSGPPRSPAGTVSVAVDGVTADGLRATDGRLAVTVRPGAIEGHARVLRAGHPLLVAEVRLDAELAALWRPDALARAPLQARASVGPLRAERHDLTIIHDQDRARARAAIARATLSVDGSLRAPRAVLDADVRAVGADRALAATARLAARYADRQVTIDAGLRSAHDGSLRATAALDADLGAAGLARGVDLRRAPWQVQLEAHHFELDGLCGFAPGLRTVSGNLDGSLRGRGTLREPHLEGRLAGRASELAISGLGDYRDVKLSVAGDENRLRLEELVAHAGAGQAHLSGDISRAEGGFRLSARADVSQFPIYVEGQPVALLTLKATATGTEAHAETSIEVGVTEARVELSDEKRRDLQPLKTPPDVVVMQGGRPRGRDEAAKLKALPPSVSSAAGVEAADAQPPRGNGGGKPVRITLRAERRIWLTGHDARIELGLSPGFRIELGPDPQIFGQVTVRRGRIDVYGRRFDIRAESTLKWSGPADRPEVDLSAQHENREEGVTVLVTIKGQLPHTSIAVSSPNRPELTESQLYTLIISGQLGGTRSAAGQTSASTEALSLAGGLVAAGLQNALSKSLHLDVFSIDTSSGSSLVGTQVEAGRYVTDRLYVGYVGRIGADPARYQNRNAVHAEYRLSSRWEIEAEYGDVGTGSADVMWKKNY
jgi:translocation and assembly module TamB